MTNLIIHPNINVRRAFLIEMVNHLMETSYKQISQLHNNPDLHIIEQPEHVSIKIEDVKRLQKEMQFKPFSSKYQLGIIFHSRMMTKEAQNAMLKTLEEQSESTIYFLLVNNEKSVLPTISSRSVKHYVKSDELEFPSEEDEETNFEEPEILQFDLIGQFNKIEEIVELDKEVKGSSQEILLDLSRYFANRLEQAISDNDIQSVRQLHKIIAQIEIAQQRMSANVNKRLLLENLLLFINKENGIIE